MSASTAVYMYSGVSGLGGSPIGSNRSWNTSTGTRMPAKVRNVFPGTRACGLTQLTSPGESAHRLPPPDRRGTRDEGAPLATPGGSPRRGRYTPDARVTARLPLVA